MDSLAKRKTRDGKRGRRRTGTSINYPGELLPHSAQLVVLAIGRKVGNRSNRQAELRVEGTRHGIE